MPGKAGIAVACCTFIKLFPVQSRALCSAAPCCVPAGGFSGGSSGAVGSSTAGRGCMATAGAAREKVRSVGTETSFNTEHSNRCFAVYFRGT